MFYLPLPIREMFNSEDEYETALHAYKNEQNRQFASLISIAIIMGTTTVLLILSAAYLAAGLWGVASALFLALIFYALLHGVKFMLDRGDQ